jgi:hypothetical protein
MGEIASCAKIDCARCLFFIIVTPMNPTWYVLNGEDRLGPYTGEALVTFAQEGRIARETMVWTEGMQEWLPAAQIEGIFPPEEVIVQAVPVQVAPAKPALATTNWAPPGATTRGATMLASSPAALTGSLTAATAPTDGSYPYFKVKPAGFGLWIGFFVGSIVSMIVMIAIIAGVVGSADPTTGEVSDTAAAGGMIGGFAAVGAAVLFLFLNTLYAYIVLHRSWKCLQYGGARTTPGAAVGYLFIPFFNLYWLFIAYKGLAEDWNRIVGSYEDLRTAPRLSEGLFLAYCICCIVAGPIALFLMFPIMSQLCKGVNFFAYRRNPQAGSALSGFGGIKFG